jgi:hypothetical protein
MMGDWGYGPGFGWFGMLSGWVPPLPFWALIVWAILAFVRRMTGGGTVEKGEAPRKLSRNATWKAGYLGKSPKETERALDVQVQGRSAPKPWRVPLLFSGTFGGRSSLNRSASSVILKQCLNWVIGATRVRGRSIRIGCLRVMAGLGQRTALKMIGAKKAVSVLMLPLLAFHLSGIPLLVSGVPYAFADALPESAPSPGAEAPKEVLQVLSAGDVPDSGPTDGRASGKDVKTDSQEAESKPSPISDPTATETGGIGPVPDIPEKIGASEDGPDALPERDGASEADPVFGGGESGKTGDRTTGPVSESGVTELGGRKDGALVEGADLGTAYRASSEEADVEPPFLIGFVSATPDGFYGPGAEVDLAALYDEPVGAGSFLIVLLNNGVSVVLDRIDGVSVSGTYAIGPTGSGQDAADLGVEGIVTQEVSDLSGNRQDGTDMPSSAIADAREIAVDTTGPTLDIVSPLGGSSVSETTPILFDYADSAPECSVDGFHWTACESGATTFGDIPEFGSLPQGAFAFTVRDTDGSGNVGSDRESGVVKDSGSPAFSSVSPVDGAHINDVFSGSAIAYTLSEAVVSGTVTMTRTGGVADEVARSCSLTGGALAAGRHTLDLSDTSDGCAVAQTLVDGAVYRFDFDAADASGNAAPTVSRFNVRFDATAPDLSEGVLAVEGHTGLGGRFKKGDAVTVRWTDASGDAASVAVDFSEFGGGAAVPAAEYSGVWSASLVLPDDTVLYGRNVRVTASDAAGNVASSSFGPYDVDTSVPSGATASVPSLSNGSFVVAWSGGSDAPSGTSGHYRILYKDHPSGSWSVWLEDTADTSGMFGLDGEPAVPVSGRTYFFEALVRDDAGNWEEASGGSGEASVLFDSDAPGDPVVTAYDDPGKARSLRSGSWYGFPAPYFEWPGVEDMPSLSGLAGSGISGYHVYFGTDAAADPETSGTWRSAPNYAVVSPMVSGASYYLRIRTRDRAGNVSATRTVFVYRYDAVAPGLPRSVVGWSDDLRSTALTSGVWYRYARPYFAWSVPVDGPDGPSAGLWRYYRSFATDPSADPSDIVSAPSFVPGPLDLTGSYYLRFRTADASNADADPSAAGNVSYAATAFTYRFDGRPPSVSVDSIAPAYRGGSLSYLRGDVTVSGVASDGDGSGVSRTLVRIRDTSAGDYWNGSSWTADTGVWLEAAGSERWAYPIDGLDLSGREGHVLAFQAKAYDAAEGGPDGGNAGVSAPLTAVVDTSAPAFGPGATAPSGTTGDRFLFLQNVFDSGSGINGRDGWVRVEYWFGDGPRWTADLRHIGGSLYGAAVSLPSGRTDALRYLFKARDNALNGEAASPVFEASVRDNDRPEVEVVRVDTPPGAGSRTRFEAEAFDDVGIDGVFLRYRYGNGPWRSKRMERVSGSGRYAVETEPEAGFSGTATYFVVAKDASGNFGSDGRRGGYRKFSVMRDVSGPIEPFQPVSGVFSGESGPSASPGSVAGASDEGSDGGQEPESRPTHDPEVAPSGPAGKGKAASSGEAAIRQAPGFFEVVADFWKDLWMRLFG